MSGHTEDEEAVLTDWPLDRLVALVGRLVGSAQQRLLAPLQLTPTGHTVLTLVAEHPLSFRDVARAAMVRPATITTVIDGLEAEGYVSRQPDRSDRRVTRVVITPTGQQRLKEADEALHSFTEEVFGALGPAATDRLRRALTEVARRAGDAA